MELYKKYRPKTIEDIVGNSSIVNYLKHKKELPHSILLTGPKGCGKTTIARIIKNILNVDKMDYKELDTAVFRGIDTIREIRSQINFSPINSKYRLWLLDECHMIGRGGDSSKNEAQNALLKALEDTPKHVYFILATTNPEMLIPTIKSRCTELKVEPLNEQDMIFLLNKVLKKEGKKLHEKVLTKIAEYSEGHPRNALQLLDKALMANGKEVFKVIKAESDEIGIQINKLCQSLVDGTSWDKVRLMLQKLKKEDPETLRRNIIGYASAMLLNGTTEASDILGWFIYKNTYDSGFPLIVQFCYNIVNEIEPPC